MSADNGYVIRLHPDGGYAAVMYFASDDEPYPEADRERHRSFPTLFTAIKYATGQMSEYGISVHDEVHRQLANADMVTVIDGSQPDWPERATEQLLNPQPADRFTFTAPLMNGRGWVGTLPIEGGQEALWFLGNALAEHGLDVEPDDGQLWLNFTGPDGRTFTLNFVTGDNS